MAPTTSACRGLDAADGQTPIQRQSDQLVHELCGLTDDEIRIVEEATTT
jgi:hypothetical protein